MDLPFCCHDYGGSRGHESRGVSRRGSALPGSTVAEVTLTTVVEVTLRIYSRGVSRRGSGATPECFARPRALRVVGPGRADAETRGPGHRRGLTAWTANQIARIRLNYGVASLPGCAASDRGVLALRGQGSHGRSHQRRQARATGREQEGLLHLGRGAGASNG